MCESAVSPLWIVILKPETSLHQKLVHWGIWLDYAHHSTEKMSSLIVFWVKMLCIRLVLDLFFPFLFFWRCDISVLLLHSFAYWHFWSQSYMSVNHMPLASNHFTLYYRNYCSDPYGMFAHVKSLKVWSSISVLTLPGSYKLFPYSCAYHYLVFFSFLVAADSWKEPAIH